MARIVGWANAAVAALTAAAALAAGAALLGDRSPQLDVLTHLAPLYGVVGLAGLAWTGLARRGPAAAASIFAIVASGLLIAPELRRAPEPLAPPDAPGQLKLIQFNVLRKNAEAGRIVDWLVAQQPDIVVLEEASPDLRDRLRRRTGWSVAGGHGRVMIFSRRDRLAMTRPPLGGDVLTFVNATYAGPAGPYEVVATHLDWPTQARFQRQHVELARIVARLPRERMILAGDFNTTPWSAALRRADRALGLRRLDRATFSFPTWAGPLAFLPIDHVYAGPGWRLVRLERGPNLGSDHYPLVVTLAPASPP